MCYFYYMSRIFVFIYISMLLALTGCSHRYGIQSQHAFIRKMTAGNIPVDNQGRPQSSGIQTAHLVYLELADTIDKPQWDTAWIKGTAYTIQPFKITQLPVTPGKVKETQEPVNLTAGPGNSLWQLLLTPLTKATPTEEIITKMKQHPIVLSGWWRGKKAMYTIKEQTELETVFGE